MRKSRRAMMMESSTPSILESISSTSTTNEFMYQQTFTLTNHDLGVFSL